MNDFDKSFAERRKRFMDSIRGGEKSSINQKRIQQARNSHKRMDDKLEENQSIGREPGE